MASSCPARMYGAHQNKVGCRGRRVIRLGHYVKVNDWGDYITKIKEGGSEL